MKKIFLIPALLATTTQALSATPHLEKYYQQQWCDEHKGVMEIVLKDFTRADCMTSDNIIEFDFGHKWAESIGQSLHYSQQMGKRAGIVLIVGPGDKPHIEALHSTINKFNLPIDVWEVKE